MVTDVQVRKLMDEMSKHGGIGIAALRSGMDRKTARKYFDARRLPSEMKSGRTWQTRADPFERDWSTIEALLSDAPRLQAKTIFAYLQRVHPGRYQDGQLRTLQRRVRRWRALSGPPKEVFFPQCHRPGEAIQTDFTWMNKLEITIGGDPLRHMLCHSVLPYSNWEWATVCRSESMSALKHGVQTTLRQLGRCPQAHQTDHSTAATHDLGDGSRDFNEDYLAFCRHYAMAPRTIAVGEKEQNGDIEAANGSLKRYIDQMLLLRGCRDFDDLASYEAWLVDILESRNLGRTKRVAEELAVMRSLPSRDLPVFREEIVAVSWASTIRVKRNTYSVPSRLIGERVTVRVFDGHIEVVYAGTEQLVVERLLGDGGHKINYRHIIDSLVKKPGAFDRFRWREDLFPSLVFRRTYDALRESLSERRADIEYLRILHLAARTMESEVETALALLLDAGTTPTSGLAKDLVEPDDLEIPELEAITIKLSDYDLLLGRTEEDAA